jgi:hypothetical protein
MSDNYIIDTEGEEALEELGAVKSSYKLLKVLVNKLSNKLLLENETLNESPASFTNIFLEEFSRSGSQAFYEQMMYKNEILPSTAIKLRSLINKLNDNQISNIYATPARIGIVLGFSKRLLLEVSPMTIYGDKRARINKNTLITIEGQPNFTLDHDIEIIITNPGEQNQNIYAKFDISDKLNPSSHLTEVNNPFINSQYIRYGNEEVFIMFIPVRQMERTIFEYDIISDNPDVTQVFTDELYGFELNYKSKNKDNFIYLEGKPDGMISSTGYNYELDLETKSIRFTFNRNPSYFAPSPGDRIRITIYTTLGSQGNFKLPNIFENYEGLDIVFNQERNDPSQNNILSIQPYLSLQDNEAVGGTNLKTLEEIRSIVINRGSSNVQILTPGELERKVQEYGFVAQKIRDDIRCLEFRVSGILKDNSDNIISSALTNLQFYFNDIQINQETNAFYLKPSFIYKKDNKIDTVANYVKEPNSFSEYFKEYTEENSRQYLFPYLIKFIASSTVEAQIYNMNLNNEYYAAKFIFFNENTNNESNILNIVLYRNPMEEDILSILPTYGISTIHSTGYFIIEFNVFTSLTVIDNLSYNGKIYESDIMKYKLVIKNTSGVDNFLAEAKIVSVDRDNKIIKCRVVLTTDDAINDNNKLALRDYCVIPVLPFTSYPIEFYFIDDTVKMTIYAVEKDINNISINTTYDDILTSEERIDNYYISTVYEIENVKMFHRYNDLIDIVPDVKVAQPEYALYEHDVFERYEADQYQLDQNGTIVMDNIVINVNGEQIEVRRPRIADGKEKGMIIYESDLEENLKAYNYEIYENNVLQITTTIGGITSSPLIFNRTTEPSTSNTTDDGRLLGKWVNPGDSRLFFEFEEFLVKYTYSVIDTVNNPNPPPSTIQVERLVSGTYTWTTNEAKNRVLLRNQNSIPVVRHIKGSEVLDELNRPVVKEDGQYYCILKNVPVYDRIYSVKSNFFDLVESYEKMLDNLKLLNTVSPDGASLTLGIRNTTGKGDYEVYDMETSSWEAIDDISLSFEIGVKFNVAISESTASIANSIVEYINTFNGTSFSINSVFENIKGYYPNIDYLILYKINNYPASKVQSIRKKDDVEFVSDVLSVRQTIDIINTDIESNKINFRPDINVRIIKSI